jgi:hypothetical protein
MFLLMAQASQPASAPAAAAGVRAEDDSESLQALQSELKLTGDAAAELRSRIAAAEASLEAWKQSDAGRELAALAKRRALAAQERDLQQSNALWTQMRPLLAEQSQKRHEVRRGILTSLTPKQQQQWAGYVLASRVAQDLAPAQLTPAQHAELRRTADACAAGAVSPEQVREDPFLLSLNQLRPEMITHARQHILTPQQSRQLPGSGAAATQPGEVPPFLIE